MEVLFSTSCPSCPSQGWLISSNSAQVRAPTAGRCQAGFGRTVTCIRSSAHSTGLARVCCSGVVLFLFSPSRPKDRSNPPSILGKPCLAHLCQHCVQVCAGPSRALSLSPGSDLFVSTDAAVEPLLTQLSSMRYQLRVRHLFPFILRTFSSDKQQTPFHNDQPLETRLQDQRPDIRT